MLSGGQRISQEMLEGTTHSGLINKHVDDYLFNRSRLP